MIILKKVLWIEDEIHTSLFLYKYKLLRSRISLDSAETISEALECLNRKYDGYVVDLILPQGPNFQTKHEIHYVGVEFLTRWKMGRLKSSSGMKIAQPYRPDKIVVLTVVDEMEIENDRFVHDILLEELGISKIMVKDRDLNYETVVDIVKSTYTN